MGDLNFELNRLAQTDSLDAQGAANAWAGTSGRELVGALNTKAGTSGVELLGVVNTLAGTTGLDLLAALQAIPTPLPVAGAVAWYDASIVTSVASSGGKVTQWSDLSGSGFHLTNSGGTTRPTTNGHTQNGLNVIEFDGVANFLRNSAISVTAANAMTVFVVAKPSALTANERLVSFDAGGNDFDGTNRIAAILRDSANAGMAGYYNNSERGTKAMTQAAHVVTSQRNGDTHVIRVDGTAGTAATGLGTANFAFTRLWAGADNTSAFYTGYMMSLIWYNSALSTTQMGLVEARIKNQWATP